MGSNQIIHALMIVGTFWIGIDTLPGAESVNKISEDDFGPDSIITRDVCVIGGGASGTYAAVSLRDLGKSVVLVEKKDRLGGHTETYTDPVTEERADIGVILYHDLQVVRDFFGRFNIPLTVAIGVPNVNYFVDYRTGGIVANYFPSDPSAAIAAYTAQLAKYPYLEAGFYLPNEVPADLLLPFGEFVKKHNLGAAVFTIFSYAQGLGNLLLQPTLYVLKIFGLDLLRNLQTGLLTTERYDNSELYQKAQAELGADVLLLSQVVKTDRNCDSSGFIKIVVQTPSGRKLIRAKMLVITIPPKLGQLQGFDLDETERNLFKQFANSAYYTGLLRNTGIPPNTSIYNIDANTPYNLPALPGCYAISPTPVEIPNLISFKYGSPVVLSDDKVKADIIGSVQRLRNAGFPIKNDFELATFSAHVPFELTVPVEAIKAGFYKKLYALQGYRSTFYSGAAFHTHDSSLLWNFTRALLPRVVDSL